MGSSQKLAVVLCFMGASGCVSATAQQDAERGLRIACASLVEAMAQNVDVPHDELVRKACDVDRTKAMIRALVLEAKDLELAPLEWLDEKAAPSPGAPSDAGAH